jgi:crotonobetainyl-CoA:carnitine CoA-transferase CaiB-like acyl-CoA transferase
MFPCSSQFSWLPIFRIYWHRGEEAERVGMRHHFMTLRTLSRERRVYEYGCRDAGIGRCFAGRIERDDSLEDPVSKPRKPAKNRAVLEDVENIFRERPHQEWLRRLEEARLPHGLVRGIGEVLAHPQTLARRMIEQVESPVGPVPVIASPLHLSASAERLDRIPALGQDTEAILKELGYSADQIAHLRNDHVI